MKRLPIALLALALLLLPIVAALKVGVDANVSANAGGGRGGGPAPRSADLSIVKVDSDDPVTEGEAFDYEITVENAGPDRATGVVVEDELPSGVSYVSASPGCALVSGVVRCSLGNVAAGASETIRITVSADEAGEVTNAATVSATEPDPDASDDSDRETTTIEEAPIVVLPPIVDDDEADLSIEKTGPEGPVRVGDEFDYEIAVTNDGPDRATGVFVEDALPAGVTLVDASPGCAAVMGVVQCALGTLADGERATVTITVRADLSGEAVNAAIAYANEDDPDLSDNEATEKTTIEGDEVIGEPPQDAPETPMGLQCVARDDGIALSWDASANATGYLVLRAEGDDDLAPYDETTETSYVDADVEADASYRYAVVAVGAGGASGPSEECSATAVPFFPSLVIGAVALAGVAGGYALLRRR